MLGNPDQPGLERLLQRSRRLVGRAQHPLLSGVQTTLFLDGAEELGESKDREASASLDSAGAEFWLRYPYQSVPPSFVPTLSTPAILTQFLERKHRFSLGEAQRKAS